MVLGLTRARCASAVVSSCLVAGVIVPACAQEQDPDAAPARGGQVEESDIFGPQVYTPELPDIFKDGKWTFGGAVIPFTTSINFNDADSSGKRATKTYAAFGSLSLIASYDSSTFFGGARYRFYGGTFPYTPNFGYSGYFGEMNFAQYAYAGLKISPSDTLTAGLLQVPFGLMPYFSSSFIETLGNTMGLEDVYNVGFKYQHTGSNYNFQLAYLPIDGGAYQGISENAARYSPNIIRSDPYVVGGTNNTERNMFIARAEYTLFKNDVMSAAVGGSLWFSSIYNYDTERYGTKKQAAVHFVGTYTDWTLMAIAARMDIDPQNPNGKNDTISLGYFDGSYNMATHGFFLSSELSYKYKPTGTFFSEIQPYFNYATFLKDQDGFYDSTRAVAGVAWTMRDLKNVYVYTEFRFGKNDPYTGAFQRTQGLGSGGDNEWKSSGSLILMWYF